MTEPARLATRKLRTPAELPRALAPPRDLWPDIAAGIAAGANEAGPRRARAVWALAAGLSALFIGILLGRLTLQADRWPPQVAQPRAEFLEASFVAERDRLRADVLERLASLPPTERERVAASVAALQRAVEDIQSALGRDPGNALLQELLVNASQDEMIHLNDINLATGAEPEVRKLETRL